MVAVDSAVIDQAAGLRRLFQSAPPAVLAILPCVSVTTPWVAQQILARARTGVRVLALDEVEACGNLADCLGASSRFELFHAVEGHVSEQQCLQDVIPGLRLAQIGRLAHGMGRDRIVMQRTLALLKRLQLDCDEWLLLAHPAEVEDLSPLILAAPRLMLVVDAQPMAWTTAWATLVRLANAVPAAKFLLCHAGECDSLSRRREENFCSLAQTRLGTQVEAVGSLGEALVLGGQEEAFADVFIQRLVQTVQTVVRETLGSRFRATAGVGG